ncbi:MAG TPA: DsbE family thiol:disulfide interchange protein [Asticcacaulis sp.]|nr:DsbE family thiol:disulfide interchange protein [Asticcacaulis sp.]
MKRALALIPLVLFVGVLGVLAYYNFHKKDHYEPRAMVGQSIPTLALADLEDGQPTKLTDLAKTYGHPILVNVYASWCEACMSENSLLIGLKDKGVTIIGVAWKDAPKDTLNYLDQHGNPYARTLSDSDGKMALGLGVTGAPETFIVRPDGTISDKIEGPIVPDTLASVEAAVKSGGKIAGQ